MARCFGVVEEKIGEADFFLDRLVECAEQAAFVEARYYFSAFASAARSVTLALQASLSGVEGVQRLVRALEREARRRSRCEVLPRSAQCDAEDRLEPRLRRYDRKHRGEFGQSPLSVRTRWIPS